MAWHGPGMGVYTRKKYDCFYWQMDDRNSRGLLLFFGYGLSNLVGGGSAMTCRMRSGWLTYMQQVPYVVRGNCC